MHAIVKAAFVPAFDVSSDLKRQQALVFNGSSAVTVGDVRVLSIVRCATASPS